MDRETHLHLARLKKICCPYGPFVCWIYVILDITSHLSITVNSQIQLILQAHLGHHHSYLRVLIAHLNKKQKMIDIFNKICF